MQLELEAQVRQEGPDEVEQGADEEINRLKETLAATSLKNGTNHRRLR